MVSLSNQARLLAAQAFNKAVIERKAREKQAEIERERREDLLRTTRRLELAKANARNAVERSRIQDAINERLRSKAEADRRAKINAEAKRKSANVFTRVAKGAKIGVLTGFEAQKDSRGRTIGISTRQSKTRIRTISLLKAEIARQQKIAREGTDLERFLKNERRLNAGQIGSAELNRQIAQRKARGLSKTPAQKNAFFRLRGEEDLRKLTARNKRKGRSNPEARARATIALKRSEAGRAGSLGSAPFTDSLFAGGGRSQQAIIGRGGTFGRRVGGQSIDDQLSFISQAKARSTSGRISFAQGLLSNLNFSGSSQSSLLSIAGNKKIRTPKTFQAELRAGVGFFTTVQAPITKPKLTKGARGQLVARRKAEDFAKATEAKKELVKQERGFVLARSKSIFDLEALGTSLDRSNLARGREIERENILAPPRFGSGFTLSPFDVSVQAVQAQAPKRISFLQPRDLVGLTPTQIKQRQNQNLRDQGFTPSQIRAGVQQGDQPDLLGIGGGLTPAEKKAQAQRVTDENKALREAGLEGFATPALVPASGISGARTDTFFTPEPTPEPSGNIFSVGLSEQIGISDVFGVGITPPPKKKGKKGKKPSPTTTPSSDFNILDPSSLISFDAPARQRVPTRPKQPAPPRETGGIEDFFALQGSFGSESLGATFSLGEAVGASGSLLDSGFDFLR